MSTKIVIQLEIDGNPEDAYHVVDSLIDAGILQDAINDHDCDAGPLQVASCDVVSSAPPSPPKT